MPIFLEIVGALCAAYVFARGLVACYQDFTRKKTPPASTATLQNKDDSQ